MSDAEKDKSGNNFASAVRGVFGGLAATGVLVAGTAVFEQIYQNFKDGMVCRPAPLLGKNMVKCSFPESPPSNEVGPDAKAIVQLFKNLPEDVRQAANEAGLENCISSGNDADKCQQFYSCINEIPNPNAVQCIESIFSAEKKGLPPVPAENNWQLLRNSSRKLGAMRDIHAAAILSNQGQARTAPELPVANRGPVPVL